jgi:hypothetical protein
MKVVKFCKESASNVITFRIFKKELLESKEKLSAAVSINLLFFYI